MTPLAWSWRDLALCRQVVTADYDPDALAETLLEHFGTGAA